MDTVVVFGAPRSGTTYLQRCLRGLRSTVCRSGTLVPTLVSHLAGRGVDECTGRALRESLSRSFDAYLNSDYHSRFHALEYWWRAPLQIDRLHHVLRRGPRPRPHRFVYKEPFFALSPELIVEGLPDANIIYIYRDGRDVANSLVESYDVLTDRELTHRRSAEMRLGRPYDERYVPWWVPEGEGEAFIESPPYVRAIWMWAHMVRRCRQYFRTLDAADRVLRLQYEAFMRNPETAGEQILDHLGASSTRTFRDQLNQARTSSIGKHGRRSAREIDAAVDIAGDALTELGYTDQ
jgi:hypothetical protein